MMMERIIPEEDMVIAEDALITDVQFALHNLLEAKGVSRAELARRLNVSEARVSQVFEEEPRNLTLKTIARFFRALGEEARLTSRCLARLIPADHGSDVVLKPQTKGDVIAKMLQEIEIAQNRVVAVSNDNECELGLAA